MRTTSYGRILRIACVLSLVGLGLMVWSLLDPTPMPVLVAMSVGQVFGTLSLLAFLGVVVADLRHAHLERAPLPSGPTSQDAR
ncbi:MAG TPA: hypothetical protein VK550_09465 [Polyangiaceae bacterium]|nr:hypothetical protein [Polyangiaceae bacterium]